MSSEIIAAIIAGSVSIVISGVTGVYTFHRNKKRFQDLREEILVKSETNQYLEMKKEYLDAFRKYQREIAIVNKKNRADATDTVQVAVDFYANYARDFYLRNKQFLESRKLDKIMQKINMAVESGMINDSRGDGVKRAFGADLIHFCDSLNEIALKNTMRNNGHNS